MDSCLKSPAKLNLGLYLVGKRLDGFYDLQSLFWPITLYDEIFLEPHTCNIVEMKKSELAMEENIAYKLLQEVSLCTKKNWKVIINKNIPMGAGLGGGSSNAGTLLRFFLTQYPEEKSFLIELAKNLGADVSFFLNPVPSWVEGKGEKISPLDKFSHLNFLILTPFFHCETKKVFSNVHLTKQNLNPFFKKDTESYLNLLHNDLKKAALKAYPDFEQYTLEIDTLFPNAQLTGSGSSFFIINPDKESTQVKINFLRQERWRIGWTTTHS